MHMSKVANGPFAFARSAHHVDELRVERQSDSHPRVVIEDEACEDIDGTGSFTGLVDAFFFLFFVVFGFATIKSLMLRVRKCARNLRTGDAAHSQKRFKRASQIS